MVGGILDVASLGSSLIKALAIDVRESGTCRACKLHDYWYICWGKRPESGILPLGGFFTYLVLVVRAKVAPPDASHDGLGMISLPIW